MPTCIIFCTENGWNAFNDKLHWIFLVVWDTSYVMQATTWKRLPMPAIKSIGCYQVLIKWFFKENMKKGICKKKSEVAISFSILGVELTEFKFCLILSYITFIQNSFRKSWKNLPAFYCHKWPRSFPPSYLDKYLLMFLILIWLIHSVSFFWLQQSFITRNHLINFTSHLECLNFFQWSHTKVPLHLCI